MAVGDYVDRMRQALQVTEPNLDTSIGTTARKILDVVGEIADEVSIDNYLLDYWGDIDTKQGADLDSFVQVFGFSRLPAKRATGRVIFARNTPAPQNILIPFGTQVATNGVPTVVFATIIPAIIIAGEDSVEIPVQAIVAGAAGNVSSHSIERFVNPIAGITSFTNLLATSGGTDAESDADLRARFKRTIFRNLAGTEGMYLAVPLENDHVSQVNVVGASKHHIEQVEIVGGTATSVVADAASAYGDSVVFGGSLIDGQIFIPDVHYSFDTVVMPPSIHVLDPVNVPDGVYDLEFDYLSTASRNNPTNNITNRIDVYVNGVNEQEAIETRLFSSDLIFQSSTGTPLLNTNFQRLDASNPFFGNYFLPLLNAPVVSVPDQITIGPVVYVEGTDYFMVNDVSVKGGAWNSLSGLEWVALANGATKPIPADGTLMVVDYTFNSTPREVAVALADWRLVSTDAMVHTSKVLRLRLYLAVILLPGFTLSSVQPAVETNLRRYVNSVGFNGVLQISDVLAVVHDSTGVDASRFLTEADNVDHWGIEIISAAENYLDRFTTSTVPRRPIDVVTGDDETIVLDSIYLSVKAQNSFGAV